MATIKQVPLKEFYMIKDMLTYACEAYGEKDAFIIKHKGPKKTVSYEHISYAQTLLDMRAFCAYLHMNGYRNARVAVTGVNSYEWVVAYYGCFFGGHIAVPIDKELMEGELEFSLEESRSEVLVYGKASEKKVLNVLSANPCSVKLSLCMAESEVNKNFHDCLAEGRKALAEGLVDESEYKLPQPEEMAILLFTSGTTSNAKAVMLSNRNITANVYGVVEAEGRNVTPADVNMAFLPMHHTLGCTVMAVMLFFGVTNVFCDGLKYIADNIVEYRVSVFVTVPLLLEMMRNKILKTAEKTGQLAKLQKGMKISGFLMKLGIDMRRKIFASVHKQLGGAFHFAIVGAAPIDKEVVEFFDALGITAIQGYGLTETSPVLSVERTESKRPGSVGFPLCNVEIKIDNPDEEGLGEIMAKAPSVMLGYSREADNVGVFKDGWFCTGDLGRIDKDGYLYIKGRQKNVIVLKNGKNVYPEELENLLAAKLPEIEEILCFGWEKDGDLLVCANFVCTDPSVDREALKARILKVVEEVNKTLLPYKVIRRLLLSDEPMEKTTTAKVRRPRVIPELQKRTDYF